MPRLFYALWPDAGTRAALAEAATRLDIRDGRAVRPENLHMTLNFLGEVGDDVTGELGAMTTGFDVRPFEFEIDDAGWWRGARVAWLAPLAAPPEIEQLYLTLQDYLRATGVPFDERPYRPHITVARKVRRTPRVSGSIAVHWRVDEFALVTSQTDPGGARYEVLNRWPLRA